MFNQKYSYLFIAISLSFAIHPFCQNKVEIKDKDVFVTIQDSIKINQYVDKLNKLSILSYKRGLYIDSILAIVPNDAYMWQQRAMPLFKQKKYEIGIIYLDNAVKYNPKRYLDYRAFMKCIFSKNYTESIKDFQDAQKLNGNSVVMDHSYSFYVGLSYLQLNKLDSSEYFLKKTIEEERKIRTDDSWIHFLHWFYLGIIMLEKEDYLKGIEYFDKSLALYPNFSDAKYYKAICFENIQKTKEALILMLEAEKDFKQGYTINEANAVYESYPYQINKFDLSAYIEHLKEGN